MKKLLVIALFAFGCAAAFAGAWDSGNTWFVATNGEDVAVSEGGGTEAAPFRTLQFAHDQASAGDTIKLTPGVYDEGEVSDGKHTNRLVVAKKLRFVSTEGRKVTAIVGKMCSTSGKEGPDAVRCVYVKSGGYDSEFHDLTFRGGAGSSDSSSSDNTGCSRWGGCIHVYGAKSYVSTSDSHRAFFIDCDIVGGAAIWGAGMAGGTAIRCLFNDNRGSSFGSAVMGSSLWNCVVFGDRNSASDRYTIGKSTVLVNCTVYGVQARGVYSESHIYNTYVDNCKETPVLSGAVVSNCVVGAKNGDLRLMLSPATGDFRPLAGSALENGGLTKLLLDRTLVNLPADCALTDFYGNPIDTESGTCHVGAVQGKPAVAATGYVTVNPGMTADGFFVGGVRTAYAQAESFPATLVLRPSSPTCMRLRANGYKKISFLYPQYDGTVHVGYPLPSVVHSFDEIQPKATLWADPAADAGTADGTEEHPYRTLQAAMDRIVDDGLTEVVVWAKPGVYAEDGSVTNGVMNRVVMPNSSVLLKSVGGAAVTTIRGADDPGSTSVEFPGCGSEAVRCVTVPKLDSNAAIQGFTFAGGRTACAGGGVTQTAGDSAGGVLYYSASKSNATVLQVLDSTFSDCCAPFNAAVHGAVCTRCRFEDCVSWGGVAANTFLIGCLVEPSCKAGPKPDGAGAFEMFKVNTHTVHSTVWDGVVFCGSDDQRNVFSSLFVTSELRGNYYYYGSVFDPNGTKTTGGTGWDKADVCFADAANGDFRLLANSSAALGGVLPKRTAAYYGVWATNYSEYVSSGLNGERIRFRDDGVPLPGCFQTCCPGSNISVASGGLRITGAEIGCQPMVEDAIVTIEPDFGSATRPIVAYVLNGVTNELTDATGSRTVTYDDVRETEGFVLTALYGTDWYVDANEGDDSRAGVTRGTAKRTLAAIMSCVASGDTVHAAPGRYAEGESRTVGATHPPERVSIPSGVKLVSDEGAAKTFIVGQLGTDAYTDTLGCGSNSMRCVNMAANTVLRGFTLTDGSAYPANGQSYTYGATYNHGAIWASARATTFVCDCVVTNCRAYLAAAGREVTFVNTLITGNRASLGVTSEANLLGCVVDGNYAGNSSVYRFTYVLDTTFCPNAYKLDGTAGTVLGSNSSAASMLGNSLILGKCTTDKLTKTVSNCVFATGCVTGKILQNTNNCWVVDADQLQVDADLRPIAGKNFACDRADPTLVTGEPTENVYLPPLRERANNGGRLDIGALEADWRGRYAEDILGRKFAVGTADRMVEETESRSVLVPEGTSLVGEILNNSARETPYLLRFVVPEDGSLTVTVGGQATDYTAGTYEVTVNATAATLPVTFASTAGTAEILRGKCLAGTLLLVR